MKHYFRHYLLLVSLSVLVPSGTQQACGFPFPGKSKPSTTIKNVVKPGTAIETPVTTSGDKRHATPAPIVDKIDPLKADVLSADKAKAAYDNGTAYKSNVDEFLAEIATIDLLNIEYRANRKAYTDMLAKEKDLAAVSSGTA